LRIVAYVPCVVAARVRSISKSEDEDTYNITLEGLARIRLPRSLPPVLSILPPTPLSTSTFSLPLTDHAYGPIPDLLPLANRLLPPQLHSRTEAIPPTVLPDLLVTVLGVEWETRVELLGLPDPGDRIRRVREILLAILASKGIDPPPDTSPKPLVPTNPTATALIRRPATAQPSTPSKSQTPEDLQPLETLRDRRAAELSRPARTAIDRELARLTKIPPQSAEYGVAKTYVEWLLALPWKRVTTLDTEVDLEQARKRLEEDHEGLEKVKRRVVEYLAVYR
jgi:ATP-dependent Lon protease